MLGAMELLLKLLTYFALSSAAAYIVVLLEDCCYALSMLGAAVLFVIIYLFIVIVVEASGGEVRGESRMIKCPFSTLELFHAILYFILILSVTTTGMSFVYACCYF